MISNAGCAASFWLMPSSGDASRHDFITRQRLLSQIEKAGAAQ